ncbi:nucleoside diphosphate kinase 6 [Toxorhynchites rutilus septentrionalis]|uniref:nucleoside diphosphate kinase 6 n=1 Tax=Toxorhynchites rutilus septentrionalis TaxID=329112 RepID=UPI00247869CA|nr:nucleoside diphosphate kinase 6 [Toxorhynchites rutilus septentrionalis]
MHGFTLAIFKPHLLKNPVAYSAAEKFIDSCGIRIVTRKQLHLTESQAKQFYQAHEGKFFYKRLISLMTSGPLEVLILSGENVLTRWRELMGPTKVFKAVYSHPDCVRSLFGLSDTRNATHGSDSESSFLTEAALFFPNQKFPPDGDQ